jgi:hypothetical protein
VTEPTNKGAEDGRQAPPPNEEKIPDKTPGNREAETGRFKKGCKPGPGRPRKKLTPGTARSAEELVQRATELRHQRDAWITILTDAGPDVAQQLVDEAVAAGQHVPGFVHAMIQHARQP